MNLLFGALGRRLADYLSAPKRQGSHVATVAPELLAATLRPGDVLLFRCITVALHRDKWLS